MRHPISGVGRSLTALATPFRDMRVDWAALSDNGDLGRFAALRDLLDPLHAALFVESNPIPVKAALAGLGLCSGEVRLPLTRATPATQEKLLAVMAPVMQAEEHAARRPALALAS